MIIKPIQEYHFPRYPDKLTALRDPLLLKSLPKRWAGKAAVITAVSATAAMMLTGCSNPTGAGVAPLFEHGSGRGAFGCDSIAPPAYLNESEAISVISEMLEAEGLKFTPSEKTVETYLPNVYPYGSSSTAMGKTIGSLALDQYDEKKKIGFEFVSQADLELWKANEEMISTVTSHPFIDAAQALQEGLTAKSENGMVLAVFYEPAISVTDERLKSVVSENNGSYTAEEVTTKLLSFSEEELRAQVADFIAWLKAEEII